MFWGLIIKEEDKDRASRFFDALNTENPGILFIDDNNKFMFPIYDENGPTGEYSISMKTKG